jgi:hypothetical protein
VTLDRERCEHVKVRLPAVSDPAPLAFETVTVIDPPDDGAGTLSEILVGSPAPRSRASTPDTGGSGAPDAGRRAAAEEDVAARERAASLLAADGAGWVSVDVPVVVVGLAVVVGLVTADVGAVSEALAPGAVDAEPATGGAGASD